MCIRLLGPTEGLLSSGAQEAPPIHPTRSGGCPPTSRQMRHQTEKAPSFSTPEPEACGIEMGDRRHADVATPQQSCLCFKSFQGQPVAGPRSSSSPPASSFQPRPRSPGLAGRWTKTRCQNFSGLEKPHGPQDKPDPRDQAQGFSLWNPGTPAEALGKHMAPRASAARIGVPDPGAPGRSAGFAAELD